MVILHFLWPVWMVTWKQSNISWKNVIVIQMVRYYCVLIFNFVYEIVGMYECVWLLETQY